MNQDIIGEITFEYKVAPSYSVHAISGAYGGLNPHGEIMMSLFSERKAIPQKETYSVNKHGALSEKPVSDEKKDTIIRYVMFGISMNPKVARSLAEWLNKQVDEYEAMIKRQKEESH